MGKKLNEGFLTCMQACDTIVLYSGMDINNLIVGCDEYLGACITVLGTRLTELPDYMVPYIAKLQLEITKLLGQDIYEDINSSSRANLLDV